MKFDDDASAKNSSQPADYGKKTSRVPFLLLFSCTQNNANASLATESLYITLIRHTRPAVFPCKNIIDNESERN
jgi:hypothetical protein